MSKYPSEITESILRQNEHISDEEIKGDIEDTLAEISVEEKKADAQEAIFNNSTSQPDRRMAGFRMDAARDGVRRRQEFVQFLELLLEARQPNTA